MLELEKSFGKNSWQAVEAFLGPTRFVSILDNSGSIAGYQVTYINPLGEPRSKVLLQKGFEDRKYFEFLMAPTFLKHGANMRIDAIKVKDDNDKSIRKSGKSGPNVPDNDDTSRRSRNSDCD